MKKQKYKTINRWLFIFIIIGTLNLTLTGFVRADSTNSSDISNRIDALLSKKQWKPAISLLKVEVQQNPTDWATRSRLLNLELLINWRDDAQSLVDNSESIAPNQIEPLVLKTDFILGPLVGRGDVSQESDSLNQLMGVLQQAELLNAADPGTLYIKGVVSKLQGNNQDAEECFLRAIYENSDDLRSQQALIDLYLHQHYVKMALPLLSQAIDEDPQNIDTLYLVGRTFLEKGDPQKAMDYLKKSRAIDIMDRPTRLLMIADAQNQLGLQQEASENYEKVLTFWPNRADLWEKYAQVSDGLQLHDQAITAYKKAYHLQPTILGGLLSDAETIFWTKPLYEALPAYERILEIAPEREDVLALLIQIRYALWQESVPPSPEALDQLQEDLNASEQIHLTTALQIVDIELQVMKQNHWTPGLQQVLQGVVSVEKSPLVRLQGQLLLNEPTEAQATIQQLKLTQNSRIEMQYLVLCGAWRVALEQAQKNPALSMMLMWVQNWSNQKKKPFGEDLYTATTFLHADKPQKAVEALQKAQIYDPLSPEIQLDYATAYLQLNRPKDAQAAITAAKVLGLSEQQQTQLSKLEESLQHYSPR